MRHACSFWGRMRSVSHLKAWTRLRSANSWSSTKAWSTLMLKSSLREKNNPTHRRNGYFLQRNIDCLSLKKSIVKILQDVQQHLCAASSVCIYSYASWNPVVLTSHIPRGGPFPSEAHMLRFTAAALLSKPRQSISGGFCDESGAYLSQRDWHTLNKKG